MKWIKLYTVIKQIPKGLVDAHIILTQSKFTFEHT